MRAAQECRDATTSEATTSDTPLWGRIAAKAYIVAGQYQETGLVLLVLVAAWQLLSTMGVFSRLLLPAPTSIVGVILSNAAEFGTHTWVTIKEVILGYALGLGVGLVLGVAIAYSRVLEKVLYPLMVVSQNMPHIALGPILVVWLGFGMEPKLALVALITFFPVTLSTVDALKSVDPEMLRFVRSLGATEWQMFHKIKVPHSLPYLFTGVKVSATYGVLAAVIGEWVGSLMLTSHRAMKTDFVFATVLVMSLVGMAMFVGAALVERAMIPWHHAMRERT
jgi:NitT/TauT family transport system permease protein